MTSPPAVAVTARADRRSLLRRYLRSQWRTLAVLAIVLVSGLAAEVASPLIIAYFIDRAVIGAALRVLILISGLTVAVAVLQQLTGVLRVYLSSRIAWTATNALRVDLAEHCLRLDETFHAQHSPGALVERVDGDATELETFVSEFVLVVVTNLLYVVGVAAALAVVDWRLGLTVLAFGIVTGVVLARIRRLSVGNWTEARQQTTELYSLIEEYVTGADELRVNGIAAHAVQQVNARMAQLLVVFRRARLRGNRIFIAAGAAVAVGQGLVLAEGVALVSAGQLSIGTVFALYFYLQLLEQPIDQLSRQLQDLQRASASVERVTALQALAVEPHPQYGLGLASVPPEIRFDRVGFHYDGADRAALDQVSFVVPAGTTLGVVGPSGAGKTTVMRLLTLLCEPQHGAITLAGRPLTEVGLAELRHDVAVVPQNVEILTATLRDNLTLFRSDVEDGRLVQVLDELGLGTWFAALPEGLDTPLGRAGDALSAGEAQLVALARVVVRDASLVVLDEASSRLDPMSERRLQTAITTLLQGRTAVVIAHRVATAMRSDRVLVLEHGRVVEQGTPSELLAHSDSRIAQLVRAGELKTNAGAAVDEARP